VRDQQQVLFALIVQTLTRASKMRQTERVAMSIHSFIRERFVEAVLDAHARATASAFCFGDEAWIPVTTLRETHENNMPYTQCAKQV
jgi:hypothetical protein